MNRNKIIISIIGLVILIIATTSIMKSENKDVIKHEYTFVGESDNWKAEYHVQGQQVFYEENDILKGDSESQAEFKLTYKGELSELSSVRRLEYEFETSAGGGRARLNSDKGLEKKVFTHSSSGNGAIESQDDEIKVKVKWDEETEEFTLKNEE